MKRWQSKMIFLGAAATVAAGLLYAFVPRPVPVELVNVTRGPLVVTVNEDGRTRVKERYVVSAPLSGRLQRVELHPGDPVEQGKTLLAVLEPTEPALLDPRSRAQAEAQVKSSTAARQRAVPLLERARTAWEFARTELERAQRLYDERTISHQELDLAEQKERMAAEELKSAQFSLQIADFELEQARAALLRVQPAGDSPSEPWQFRILSPIHGRVLRVFQESSAVVLAGERLLELGNPRDLEIEVDVLSTEAVRIQPGAKVFLDHWGGDAVLLGRVRLVEPSGFMKVSALGIEEQRVNVVVDLVGAPETRLALGDGFRVEARIVTWEASNVLKLAVGALFRADERWAVFVVIGGRAQLRSVQIGQRNSEEVEILEGLALHDRVIVHPSDRIRENIRVTPR